MSKNFLNPHVHAATMIVDASRAGLILCSNSASTALGRLRIDLEYAGVPQRSSHPESQMSNLQECEMEQVKPILRPVHGRLCL